MRRLSIVLALMTVVLSIAAAVGYVRTTRLIIPIGECDRIVVVLHNGKLKVAKVNDECIVSHPGDALVDQFAKRWVRVPWLWLEWPATKTYAILGSTIQESSASVSLVVCSFLALFAVWIRYVRSKYPGRFRRLAVELIRPSIQPRFGRLQRYSTRLMHLVFLCLAGVTMAGLLAVILPIGGREWNWGSWGDLRVNNPFFTSPWQFAVSWRSRYPVSESRRCEVIFIEGEVIFTAASWSKVLSDSAPTDDSWSLEWLRWVRLHVASFVDCGLNTFMDDNTTPACVGLTDASLTMKTWVPLLVFLTPPLIAFLRGPWRRSKRWVTGRCMRCGYDLRGLADARCPECGTEFVPRAEANSTTSGENQA